MLTHCHFPGGAPLPENSPTDITRASAGDTTMFAVFGVVRSGSRKKKRKNAARMRKGTDQARPSHRPTTTATSKAPPMKGQPALSINIV